MGILKNTVISLHKYLGTLMSFLFLMWCLTGFVLLFVGFPHASRQERYIELEPFSDSSLESILPLDDALAKGVSVEMCNDRPVYRIKKGKKLQVVVDAQTLTLIDSFSLKDCESIALNFLEGDISHTDKVSELDSWIPWSYYKPLLPFYKFYYNDDAHSVVYASSVIGAVVQETTRYTRWMARIGAIPHWVYFKQIKSNDGVYKTLITVLGIIGFVACLSGLILGLIRMKRNARGQVMGLSVFKKRMYRYHHVFGLFVGVFLSAYILSGLLYTTGVPEWMVAKEEGESAYYQWNKESSIASLPVSSFYRQLPNSLIG